MSENTSSSQAETCVLLSCCVGVLLLFMGKASSECLTHKETDYGTEQNVTPQSACLYHLYKVSIWELCARRQWKFIHPGYLRNSKTESLWQTGCLWYLFKSVPFVHARQMASFIRHGDAGCSERGASPVDLVDLTFALDDSSDHCEYQCCKNRKVNSDPYKFQPGEEKFQMKACLCKDGPATLRNLGTETLTLTTCKSCAMLASKKTHQMAPPPVPTIPGIHLLEVADAILKVIASIPNTLSIDESVKKAKAKGAALESRLPVVISSLLNKNALKTGYSPAHYLYNSEKDKFCKLAVEGQGVLAKVFVQVKRENGTKKGISFHISSNFVTVTPFDFWQNVQHGVSFPPPTPHTEVVQCMLESLLVLVQAHHKVKGFKFTTDNFFVVDSGWIPVLEGDLMKPTELFYKGITKGLSKKGTPVGGLKYSQGAPENWYMILNPAVAERYDEWEAGDTPKSSPVKNGKGKKREEPELDSDMDDLSDIDYVSIVSGPPESTISANSEQSYSSKWVHLLQDVPSSKRLCTGIDVSDCTKWFDVILDIIDTGGTYLESSFNPGLPEWAVEICLIPQLISGLLSSPQFTFTSQLWGHIYVGMNLEGVDVPAALQGKVCIKQPYFGLMTRQGVQRMTDDVECTAVLQEANTLVWANAIHDMSIALYVSNGAPEPVEDVSEDHLAIATFLCFLQHLQYSQTLGKCFVSDYQGAGKWLTDPQVMAKSAYCSGTGNSLVKEMWMVPSSNSRKGIIVTSGALGSAYKSFEHT
ncbi:uncharacterized protein EV420DRAFT_1485953 [Desarmillaria tabescens]|uniref:Alpha-type protein kinase domain-containing protein n=1 Tax=Armillaria tabescens TaxID=1929756 RepID=A0AA39MN71_ARMTA|nr:uncharacterized protein EV420DRAFT_1485953 [Desarmillaria tabescens]KAK0440492.1 hypothetical protein EV420DRAFT_1485953 [Desarmillaria tabescens]